MLKVGITGNIAAGKSTVEKILKEKGYSVLDTDIVSHDLLENDSKIIKTVIKAFNDYKLVSFDGKISRTKLGKIVFSDKMRMRKLESIIHPVIREKICEYFDAHKDEDIVFVSVPLLYEAHMEDLFDRIILVFAEDQWRYKRLIKRDRLDEEYASKKINSQMSQVDKLILCDDCIENDGTVSDLRVRVAYILRGLKRLNGNKNSDII